MPKITFKNLRRFNLAMAGLHALQGLAVLILATDFALPLTANYLSFDEASQSLVSASTQLGSVPIAPLVAIFFFLSASAHLLLAGPLNEWYNRNLKQGINKARWVEYALSASLMIVLIALLAGVYDLGSLILLFGITTTMNLFGYLMELHNQTTKRTDWTSFTFGALAGIVPWIVIGLYFVVAIAQGGQIPTFVYWIYASLFLFFNTFPINMYLQYKKAGKWKDYLYGERTYIILSLVAKSLLAWQIYAGTLRPV